MKIDYYNPMKTPTGLDSGYSKLVEYTVQIPLSNYSENTLAGKLTVPLPSGYDGASAIIVGGATAESSTATTVTFPVTLSVSSNTATLSFTAEYKAIYTATVNGSYAATSGAGSYIEGATVTINAGSRGSYAFDGWTADSDGVVFADSSGVITTFPMPAGNVAVTANWRYIGGSGGSSGGSTGGSSDSGYTQPANITVYNDANSSEATIWLTGGNLSQGDRLVTEKLVSGADYSVMLKLVDKDDILEIYNISLSSGKSATGGAMYLSFALGREYAKQTFTLVHKKADGSLEYFDATADANGRVSFGPFYELSPFMLVKGTLSRVATQTVADVPATGGSAAGAYLLLIAACLFISAAAYTRRIRRKA